MFLAPWLHRLHRVRRFCRVSAPPKLFAVMWPTCKTVGRPWSSRSPAAAPHIWQVLPSRLSTSARSFGRFSALAELGAVQEAAPQVGIGRDEDPSNHGVTGCANLLRRGVLATGVSIAPGCRSHRAPAPWSQSRRYVATRKRGCLSCPSGFSTSSYR